MLRVADDADDRNGPTRLRRGEPLANRILSGPRAPGKRLVDDRHERRLQVVALREVASLQKRDLERPEVVRGYEMEPRLRHRRRVWRRRALDRVADGSAVTAERNRAYERRRFDARHRADVLDGALEEPRDVIGRRILALRQPELQRENARCLESERDALHRQQA